MRILFIASRPPWPSRRGDQARLAGWIRELGSRHEIAVVAQRPPGFSGPPFPTAVHGRHVNLGRAQILWSLIRRSRLPLQVAWHYQARLSEIVRKEAAKLCPEVAVIVLSRLGWLRPALGDVPVVVDIVDSLALNMRHRARRQPVAAALWRWEARRIECWDRDLTRAAARATVVSARDRQALVGDRGELEERVEVVPFGLPLPPVPPPGPCSDPVVLLAGNLGYFPTRDGALWLAREVWPRVRNASPGARWWLAGSRIPRALRRLERLPGVEIRADPTDLSALRRRAAVAVAPMRSGSGTPIKILEAMADGVPVVATPEAAAGLDALAGGEVAIGGDGERFAAAVVRLIQDPEAARRQVASAWSWLKRRHDLPRVACRFERLLEEAAATAPRRGASGSASRPSPARLAPRPNAQTGC